MYHVVEFFEDDSEEYFVNYLGIYDMSILDLEKKFTKSFHVNGFAIKAFTVSINKLTHFEPEDGIPILGQEEDSSEV